MHVLCFYVVIVILYVLLCCHVRRNKDTHTHNRLLLFMKLRAVGCNARFSSLFVKPSFVIFFSLLCRHIFLTQLKQTYEIVEKPKQYTTLSTTKRNKLSTMRMRTIQFVLATSDVSISKLRYQYQGMLRYDTRGDFKVRSKADMSQLNLPHENDN